MKGERSACHPVERHRSHNDAMVGPPSISLIVASRNRARDLRRCLESIERAVAQAESCEIIIVDNGSVDETPAVIREFCQKGLAPFQHCNEPRQGLSRARNAGLRVASGTIIAFTDDDCVLSEDFFASMTNHWQHTSGPALCGGRVELGNPCDQPFTIRTGDKAERFDRSVHPAGFVQGCNFAFNRQVLEIVGEFDERLGAGSSLKAGEDTDYLIRTDRAGIRIEYTPSIVVHHHHGRSRLEAVRELNRNYALGNGAIYAKHWHEHRWLLKNFIWDIKCFMRMFFTSKERLGFEHKMLAETIIWNMYGFARYVLSDGEGPSNASGLPRGASLPSSGGRERPGR